MSVNAPKVAFIVGLLLVVIAFFLKLLAISLPWWAYKEYDFFGANWKVNDGLWKSCQKTNNPIHGIENNCITHMEPADFLVTTRSLLTFALVLLGIGSLAVLVQKWCLKEMVLLGFIGALVVCFAGALSWIATIEFTKKYVEIPGNHPDDINVCWILALTSSASCFVSGILFAARKICVD